MLGHTHAVRGGAAAAPGTVTVRTDGTPEGALVCLVVPSIVHVFQAAWVADLDRGGRLDLARWLTDELAADDQGPASRAWRYDLAVGALAADRGVDGVVLVAGDRPGVQEALGGLGGPEPRLPADVDWPGLLDAREVALLGSWLEQLDELGLTGPVAGDLVGHWATRLPETTPAGAVEPPALPEGLGRLVERRTRAMADAVRDAGVRILGDAEALVWPAAGSAASATVPTSTATALAVGVLERTLEWAGPERAVRR